MNIAGISARLATPDALADAVQQQGEIGVVVPIRAEVRDGRIIVTPEALGLPRASIPNNVGALGVSPRDFAFHSYDVQTRAPNGLQGPSGLAAVNSALRANPTPGIDQAATSAGTRNNVGGILPFGLDGRTNFVRSFVFPTPEPGRFTDIIVNYTQRGEHSLAEGFVMRYGALQADGSIVMRSHGEGNGLAQHPILESRVWGSEAQRVWTANHNEIFDQALGSR